MDPLSRPAIGDELAGLRSLPLDAPPERAGAAQRLLAIAERMVAATSERPGGGGAPTPSSDPLHSEEDDLAALATLALRVAASTPEETDPPAGLNELFAAIERLLAGPGRQRVLDGVVSELSAFRYRAVAWADRYRMHGPAEALPAKDDDAAPDRELRGYLLSLGRLVAISAALGRMRAPWCEVLHARAVGAAAEARDLIEPLLWNGARRRGFRLQAVLPLLPGEGRGLVAPSALRVERASDRPALPAPGTASPRGEGPSPGTPWELAIRPEGEPGLAKAADVRELALAERRLDLAGTTLTLFGGTAGFSYVAQRDGGQWMDGDWTPQARGSTGDQMVLPVLVDPILGHVPQERPAPFRPGRLRRLLRLGGANVDRAYSPRAYVVTVGTSAFKSLFGWDVASERELLAVATPAGCDDGPALVRWLLGERGEGDPLAHQKVRALALDRTADPARPGTLGDLLDRWETADPLGRGTGGGAWIGGWAELDTIRSLLETNLRPVAGDRFVLVPTRTAASALSALLLARAMARAFPGVPPRVAPNSACAQRQRLDDVRFDYADQPLQATREVVGSLLDDLLSDGADPVVIATGGTKPLALASCDACRDRRVPWIHKTELSAPLLVDWEWSREARPPRGAPPLVAGSAPALPRGGRWLVIPVGLRLFQAYRREAGSGGLDFAAWARQPRAARSSPEITGFRAWRASLPGGDAVRVALLRSMEGDGMRCAGAVEELLRAEGAEVFTHASWDLLGLPERGGEAAEVGTIFARQAVPVLTCLEAIRGATGEAPDVYVMPGRKVTGVVAHFAARQLGLRSLLSPEPEEDAAPALWVLEPSGEVMHHVYDLGSYPG